MLQQACALHALDGSNSIRTACFRCITRPKSTNGKTGPTAEAPPQQLDLESATQIRADESWCEKGAPKLGAVHGAIDEACDGVDARERRADDRADRAGRARCSRPGYQRV
jgi:hypothetical protein